MMRSIIHSAPARTTAAIFLTLGLVFGIYSIAQAAFTTSIVPPAPLNCTGLANVNYSVTWTAQTGDPASFYGTTVTGPGGSTCRTDPVPYPGCPAGPCGATNAFLGQIPAGTLPGDVLTVVAGFWSDAGCTTPIPGGTYGSYVYNCSTGLPPGGGGGAAAGAAVEPPARTPAVWLAGVCEPLDGFSSDGWMTIDSDVWELPFDRLMYVGPSIDGPWMSIDMPGPPYIVNQETMNVIASVVGVSDYHEVWIRISTAGQPAQVGSMIIDRDWGMQALCGG